MSTRTIMLTVDVETDADVVRTVETLSRAVAGLLLEGLDARLSSYVDDDATE